MKLKAMVMATSKLPQGARQAIFDKFPAPYEITGVVAGGDGCRARADHRP